MTVTSSGIRQMPRRWVWPAMMKRARGRCCLVISAARVGAHRHVCTTRSIRTGGHTVSAEFPFTWAPADPSATVASVGTTAAPRCDAADGDGTADGSDGANGDSTGDSPADESGNGAAPSADLGNVRTLQRQRRRAEFEGRDV